MRRLFSFRTNVEPPLAPTLEGYGSKNLPWWHGTIGLWGSCSRCPAGR